MERKARLLSFLSLSVLTVIMVAYWGPWAWNRFLVQSVERTHLLYSPTLEQFIYREEIVGSIPPEARALAEDHHAGIAYRDEAGNWYSRVDFEKNLPFIYYKNMELWGLMPLHLKGQTFQSSRIRAERQVVELNAREVLSARVATNLRFLLDDRPGGAGLVLPVEALRIEPYGVELVNADVNKVDQEKSRAFTQALNDAGAVWPLQGAYGNETILKAANAGFFLIDKAGKVFHLRRKDGVPSVADTGVSPDFGARYVAVSESARGEFFGFVVGSKGRLGLLMSDYRLIELPVEGYDPEVCNVKMVCDPLYRTLVWDDGTIVRGAVMDREYRLLHRFEHRQSAATDTPAKRWGRRLFPLKLSVADDGRKVTLDPEWQW